MKRSKRSSQGRREVRPLGKSLGWPDKGAPGGERGAQAAEEALPRLGSSWEPHPGPFPERNPAREGEAEEQWEGVRAGAVPTGSSQAGLRAPGAGRTCCGSIAPARARRPPGRGDPDPRRDRSRWMRFPRRGPLGRRRRRPAPARGQPPALPLAPASAALRSPAPAPVPSSSTSSSFSSSSVQLRAVRSPPPPPPPPTAAESAPRSFLRPRLPPLFLPASRPSPRRPLLPAGGPGRT